MSRRRGLSLVEFLVVTALLAVLTAATLAGVQRVRAASVRADCADRLRQVAVGLHGYHNSHGRLPTGLGNGTDPYPFMTWCARLLPYLEQPAAWTEAVADYRSQPAFFTPVPHRNLARPMPAFVCPAGTRRVGTTAEGQTAGFTYYLGVSGGLGQNDDGVFYKGSATRLADLADGTSSTLGVGERPPSSDAHFGWWYAGIGQRDFDGSIDSVMPAREFNRSFYTPTCPAGPYSFGPGRAEDECSRFHFWSEHPGGAHFALMDGSVRFLTYSAAAILPALATRAGGESVQVPD